MATQRPVGRYVFDSFACMAFLGREPGYVATLEILQTARRGEADLWMSWVNAGEVYYQMQRRRGQVAAEEALVWLSGLPITFVPADADGCLSAARLKAEHPISYADAFCAALAIEKDARVLTGDPEFACLEPDVQIEWLPSSDAPDDTSPEE